MTAKTKLTPKNITQGTLDALIKLYHACNPLITNAGPNGAGGLNIQAADYAAVAKAEKKVYQLLGEN